MTRADMALAARTLALRGESLFIIDGTRLVPAYDWEVSTQRGIPRAYRATVGDVGGGSTITALAPEVVHFRCGVDPATPWAGVAPLRRAELSSEFLVAVEESLRDVFRETPLGSQVLPMPEMDEDSESKLAASFRGQRGRVLIRESVNVQAAGGPAPVSDWKPQNLTPDLQGMVPAQMLSQARAGIMSVYGVLPSLVADDATGPQTREAQRHLAVYTLQPLALMMAEELSDKLGADVSIDTLRPIQAFDTAGRARAMGAIIEALGRAKELGIDPEKAMQLVAWDRD